MEVPINPFGDEEAARKFHNEAENCWENLSKDEQLKVFYCVTKRLNHAYSQPRKLSYRHILYGLFGFKEAAYGIGIESGFINVHNGIFSSDELENIRSQAVEDYKQKLSRGNVA